MIEAQVIVEIKSVVNLARFMKRSDSAFLLLNYLFYI